MKTDLADGQDQRRESYLEEASHRAEGQLESTETPGDLPLPSMPLAQPLQLAQASKDAAERESPEQKPAEVNPATPRPLSPDEIVAAIKLRAQRELAKRRARKWSLSTVLTETVGNESNPQLQKVHKSALYMEEYLSTTFGYKVTPKLTWQAGYNLDALNYDEYTDGSTLTDTLLTKLIYRPLKTIRLEGHYTFNDTTYPYDAGSSTWDQKVHVRLRQSFWNHYYHYVGWTYMNKQYKDKGKRFGSNERHAGELRKDNRHTGIYEIGGTFAEANTLKVKQEFYFNDSNDIYQDYSDTQDYKVKVTLARDWTKRWSSSSSFTYERKQYAHQNVSGPEVARKDSTNTYDLGLTYKFNDNVDLTYGWKYQKNLSNDRSQDYQNVTNSLALTAAF